MLNESGGREMSLLQKIRERARNSPSHDMPLIRLCEKDSVIDCFGCIGIWLIPHIFNTFASDCLPLIGYK